MTLEIRRLYHGPLLTSGATGGAEQYTYSIAWLAFGVALLGIGIVFNSQRARLASAVVIALTILKAFLIDMSTLTGVYRALSFMCLGLVLVAIGWLYQRILFRKAAPPPSGRAAGDVDAQRAFGDRVSDSFPGIVQQASSRERSPGTRRSLGRAAQFRSAFRFRRLSDFASDLTGSILALSTCGVSTRADTSTEPVRSGGCSERGRATARAISICAAP